VRLRPNRFAHFVLVAVRSYSSSSSSSVRPAWKTIEDDKEAAGFFLIVLVVVVVLGLPGVESNRARRRGLGGAG